ncbi:MAG: PqqD family protein [Salinivirgaceae bacterium]|jgi:hypothetical protein|nr:PqqD family protein [Salinivirgaceae bacterium]
MKNIIKLKTNIAISEKGFMFDPSTGDSYTVNAIGLEILGMIQQGKVFVEISDMITAKYDVEPSSFEQYFFDFIAVLKQMQLIENNDA